MGEKVSRETAIQALIAHPHVKQAAAVAGVAEKTLHRWLKEPEFNTQLIEAQREVSKRVTRAVISRAERAATVLDDIMTDKKISPHTRVMAAKTLLETAFKAIETEDILTRLDELEKRAEEDE